MASNQSALTNWTQYLLLRLGASAINTASPEQAGRVARKLGDLMYRIDRKHRQRGITNLQRCFPDMSDNEATRITRRSMQHFIQLGSEIFFTTREIHADSWVRRVRTDAFAEALDTIMSGRPVLLVTGHIGNWELLGYWLATVGVDIDALARPIDNPLINNWLLGVRERQGMRIITKWGATERMAEVVRDGGLLGFIGDQNAGDKGIFVPFFNRLASAYKSVGLFALRFRVPIICGYAVRVGNGFQYQVGVNDIIQPEAWEAQPDPLYYLTARYTLALENQVRMAPDQYLWIHRRWKSRPKHEREGRPMPDALRKKIQALPWITDEQMVELEKPIPPEKHH